MKVNIPWLTDRLGVMGFQPKAVQIVQLVLAAILAVGLCVAMKIYYDRTIIAKHEAEVNVEVLEKTIKANEEEANAAATDQAIQDKKDEERVEAIAKATETTPSDPSRRLGCQRLREAGYDTSRIAACKFD